MNVLIINLTRFGDLIQTQPVISGYTSLGHRVALVCLSNFASAATLLDGVEKVFSFPGAGLLSKLDEQWQLAIRDASQFKADILDAFLPDRVVNLTPSISSRLLASDLAVADASVVGFGVDEFGFNADTSAWAAFLQIGGSNRGASPFNVCDIFRRTAELRGEGSTLDLVRPDENILEHARGVLASAMPHKGRGYIAVQLGASEDRRRWPVDSFRETARLAWEHDGLIPVLLGTKGEAELGERFVEGALFPVISLIGKTSLVELAGVLCQCDALMTNDTGTMHLAAGLGIPVCAVFLATAQPWDTGPYSAGNICLEPDLECHPCDFGKPCPNQHVCRRIVTSEVFYEALTVLLQGRGGVKASGSRAWLTRMCEDGFMGLTSLSGHDQEDRTLWIAMQHAYYSRFLDGDSPPEKTGLVSTLSAPMADEISKTLTSAHDMLFLLSQQGMLLAKNPRPQAKSKFLASWQRLQNILGANRYLNILGILWMFESQGCGDDLDSLLEVTERYRELFASMLYEFK
ncbi:glycosyltransferase family 9 protein [Pseudodesulfovibrio piezophilus]|uniref:Glycosyl transferase family 9 n=1 Tax=Pseudodesulfovibrio piezophilus (strain DSM 21447 / JCM 15486 / C1TLV30) TaxID=1322246 RepID=M1WUG2_PSEP2|nr:glycosyltransferase family 9 protein [Pseudodesulfovibrio piezophilus]CCH47283.1 Glycosyl transferase family 9 [Pseudodesulfovibrio piezophilus C1TLV30]